MHVERVVTADACDRGALRARNNNEMLVYAEMDIPIAIGVKRLERRANRLRDDFATDGLP